MPENTGKTVNFKKVRDGEDKVSAVLQEVYQALEEKGYDPINQLVGYMLSGEPAYVTSYNGARNLICKVDRDEIMEVLLRDYLLDNK